MRRPKRKVFIRRLLRKRRRRGFVRHSPFLHTTPEHAELKDIAKSCITRHHAHHYFGFSQTQWKLFEKESPRRVKPLLYVYRVLLTGIHLMRTGIIESNLLTLNTEFNLPQLPDLISRKLAGPEQSTLHGGGADAELAFHRSEFDRLRTLLQSAHDTSSLPDTPTALPALNDLLLRLRTRPN